MMSGVVRFYNDIVGYGFIDPDIGTYILKVSYKDIKINGYRLLNEGQRVQFEIASDSNSIAKNVIPLDLFD
jgi:CspA family cold shock protein